MIPLLLATALSCGDAEDLISNVLEQRGLNDENKSDLIEVIKTNTENGCWDAND